ncbi:MAG: Nudix family hydrolase [Arenicellales bacterium]
MNESGARIEVAVGVVYDARGRVLVNQRQAGKAFAGQWEFPGGKIETGESPPGALARELAEELGINVERQRPLICLSHRYENLRVRLHVNEVLAYGGVPRALEGQNLRWIEPEGLRKLDLLAADAPIVRAILLPRVCLVTDSKQFGVERTLGMLDEHLNRGRALVILREKTMDRDGLEAFADRIRDLCRAHDSLVCVHADCDFGDYTRVDGVHLSARRWARGERPRAGLTGVSCHTVTEVREAHERGADYLLLSPVRRTPSHPQSEPLGWERFAAICREAGTPVYALGGMRLADFDEAADRGAQGVALLSAAWR